MRISKNVVLRRLRRAIQTALISLCVGLPGALCAQTYHVVVPGLHHSSGPAPLGPAEYRLSVDKTLLDFGVSTKMGEQTFQSITVTNTGEKPITGIAVPLHSSGPSLISINGLQLIEMSRTCDEPIELSNIELAPGQSCTFHYMTVVADPGFLLDQIAEADFQITSNEADPVSFAILASSAISQMRIFLEDGGEELLPRGEGPGLGDNAVFAPPGHKVSFWIQNDGTAPLEWNAGGVDDSPNVATSNACQVGEPIAPSSGCRYTVDVGELDGSWGSYSQSVYDRYLQKSNYVGVGVPVNGGYNFSIRRFAFPCADAELIYGSYEFIKCYGSQGFPTMDILVDGVPVPQSMDQSTATASSGHGTATVTIPLTETNFHFTLQNNGDGPLEVVRLIPGGPFTLLPGSTCQVGSRLEPGQSCEVQAHAEAVTHPPGIGGVFNIERNTYGKGIIVEVYRQ